MKFTKFVLLVFLTFCTKNTPKQKISNDKEPQQIAASPKLLESPYIKLWIEALNSPPDNGPLIFKDDILKPNSPNYPFFSQIPEIHFLQLSSNTYDLELASAESWLTTLGTSDIVAIQIKDTKNSPEKLMELTKLFGDFENPKKFSPKIKFYESSHSEKPQPISSAVKRKVQIKWSLDSSLDASSQTICQLITGWIDYQLLKLSQEPQETQELKNPWNLDLKCTLKMMSSIQHQPIEPHIEIGRLSLPLWHSKSKSFPLKEISDLLSPTTLLGLGVDL